MMNLPTHVDLIPFSNLLFLISSSAFLKYMDRLLNHTLNMIHLGFFFEKSLFQVINGCKVPGFSLMSSIIDNQ